MIRLLKKAMIGGNDCGVADVVLENGVARLGLNIHETL